VENRCDRISGAWAWRRAAGPGGGRGAGAILPARQWLSAGLWPAGARLWIWSAAKLSAAAGFPLQRDVAYARGAADGDLPGARAPGGGALPLPAAAAAAWIPVGTVVAGVYDSLGRPDADRFKAAGPFGWSSQPAAGRCASAEGATRPHCEECRSWNGVPGRRSDFR